MKEDLSTLSDALDGLLASLSELKFANTRLKSTLYGIDKRSRAQVEHIQQEFRNNARGPRKSRG